MDFNQFVFLCMFYTSAPESAFARSDEGSRSAMADNSCLSVVVRGLLLHGFYLGCF